MTSLPGSLVRTSKLVLFPLLLSFNSFPGFLKVIKDKDKTGLDGARRMVVPVIQWRRAEERRSCRASSEWIRESFDGGEEFLIKENSLAWKSGFDRASSNWTKRFCT